MVGTINPHIGLSPTSNQQPMLGAHKKALQQKPKGLEWSGYPNVFQLESNYRRIA